MKKYLTKSNIGIICIIISILLFSINIYFLISSNDNNCDVVDKDNDENNNNENNDEFINSNTNEGVISDKEVNGLKFTNASLVSNGNTSTLTTIVENITDMDKEVKVVYIYVKDKYGETIIMMQGYVGEIIPAGESRTITSTADVNLNNAVSIEYKLNNE